MLESGAGTGDVMNFVTTTTNKFLQIRISTAWRVVSIIILVVLCLGTGFAITRGNYLPYPDEQDYLTVATGMLERHEYAVIPGEPTAFRPPLYSLLLSGVLKINGGILGCRMTGVCALGLNIVLVFVILWRVSAPAVGIVGAVITACYPLFLYSSTVLYPQVVGSSLLLLLIYFIVSGYWRPMVAFVVGILWGMLVHLIPSFVPILPIYLLLGVILGNLRRWLQLALFALGLILVITPWIVRNRITMDAWIPISSNSGFMLLAGNSENATPQSGPDTDIQKYVSEANRMHMNEVEKDKYYRQQAIRWMVNHPHATMKLYVKKVLTNFHFKNNLHTKQESSKLKDLVMLFTYGPLLVVFATRWLLVKQWKPMPFEWTILVLYLAGAFASSVFFSRIRYRIPFDYLLIMGVAVFVVTALGHVTRVRDESPQNTGRLD